MFARWVWVWTVCLSCWIDGCSGTPEVEALVRRWAPLVWLAPEEKFMPSNVEAFLDNINVADEKGGVFASGKQAHTFHQFDSKSFFLVPNKPLDKLKFNRSSFLYGKNPRSYPTVPVYAVITYCVFADNARDVSLPPFHVTYWMFYPYNEGKDICFLGKLPAPLIFSKCLGHYRKLGNHVGDWEHMGLYFTEGKAHPDKLFLSVHDAGAYYKYVPETRIFRYDSKLPRKGVAQVPKFPEFVRLQGGHPVIFAAEGSHGLWSAPGDHEFIRVPRISDRTGYGTPWKTWASAQFYHLGVSEVPAWMLFKGKWGNPKTKCVLFKKFGLCEYTEGPKGLLRDRQDFYC